MRKIANCGKRFRHQSLAALEIIYQRLGVQFDHTLGESFYNNALSGVVRELTEKGIAQESEGAIAIFSERAGDPRDDPFLVFRKEPGEEAGRYIDNPHS